MNKNDLISINTWENIMIGCNPAFCWLNGVSTLPFGIACRCGWIAVFEWQGKKSWPAVLMQKTRVNRLLTSGSSTRPMVAAVLGVRRDMIFLFYTIGYTTRPIEQFVELLPMHLAPIKIDYAQITQLRHFKIRGREWVLSSSRPSDKKPSFKQSINSIPLLICSWSYLFNVQGRTIWWIILQ